MKYVASTALIFSLHLFAGQFAFGQCFVPLANESESISENEHLISWGQNAFAISFSAQYRQLNGNAEWVNVYGITGNNLLLTDLMPCANYEYQVRMVCENDSSEFSNLEVIQTLGCGACHDGNYCVTSTMNSNGGRYIARVRLNTLDNITGSALDSWNYTHLGTTIAYGEPYQISVQGTQGWSGNLSAHIDWNGDGDFYDAGEYIHNFGSTSGTLANSPWFQIPNTAAVGCKRMRIVWTSSSNNSTCPSGSFDSVEDYCLCVSEGIPTNIAEKTSDLITLYPNPIANILNIDLGSLVLSDENKNTFLLYNTMGQIVLTNSFENSSTSISLSHLPNGFYQAVIIEAGNILLRKPVIISK